MTTHIEDGCCSYEEANSRRAALRAGIGLAAIGGMALTFGDAFVETSYAATGKADEILVVLSMRGAADGLSLLVPHGDPFYYKARPTIGIPKDKLWGGDAMFGLHPSLLPLKKVWDKGNMAVIHSAGQEISSRSHFLAMEEVEDADPGSSERIGWLNRLVGLRSEQHLLQAVQWGANQPATQIFGPNSFISATEADRLRLAGPEGKAQEAARMKALGTLWANSPTSLGKGARQAIQLSQEFKPVRESSKGQGYPTGDLATALASTARTIKANVGAEVITVDHGSWDHHQWIGNLNDGNIKRMANEFATCLAAFFDDLGPFASKVTVITVSEFGRRVTENANQGVDHGDGTIMFAFGEKVKGGFYGQWAGLHDASNDGVRVTTDYRSVLSEVVSTLYPERNTSVIFPAFKATSIGFMSGAVVPTPKPKPEPEKPKPTPKPEPKPYAVVKSWSNGKGLARRGKTLTAPKPTLTTAGEGAKVTYSWTVSGKKVSSKSTLKVKKAWRKKTVKVTVSASKKGGVTSRKGHTWRISSK